MLKKLGIPTLALVTAMAVAAPAVTFARDNGDHRGGDVARHETAQRGTIAAAISGIATITLFAGRPVQFGVGFVAPAPVAPAATGYYDQYGIWYRYGYYDQFGIWRAY